jgi:hypothetical protein
VFNNGHTIQVQWAPGTVKSTVMVPAAGKKVTDVLTAGVAPAEFKEVPAEPLQFHFHTDSEHAQRGGLRHAFVCCTTVYTSIEHFATHATLSHLMIHPLQRNPLELRRHLLPHGDAHRAQGGSG